MVNVVELVPEADIEPLLTLHLASVAPSLAPRSLVARRLTVLRVARKLGHPVATTTYPALLEWQIAHSYLARASMSAALSHLGGYLSWAAAAGHRSGGNPVARLYRPRHAHTRDPRPMPECDVARALERADPVMHAWIGLGAFCGLRCMEIAAVSRADILDGPRIRIHGKGSKVRVVRLPARLHAELAAFPDRGNLWRDRAGDIYTPPKVSRTINTYLRGIGVDGTAHMLRHRFGTQLYRACRDVVAVQHAMGHASVETTMCYVRHVGDVATDDAIEAISVLAAAA